MDSLSRSFVLVLLTGLYYSYLSESGEVVETLIVPSSMLSRCVLGQPILGLEESEEREITGNADY